MSEDQAPGQGHNSRNNDLLATIEVIENLEEERKKITQSIGDRWRWLKDQGYETDILKSLVKLRKKSEAERRRIEIVRQLYMAALKMRDGVPLDFRAVEALQKQHEEDREAKRDLFAPLPEEQPPEPPAPEAAQDTEDQARARGEADARAGKRIIDNPYPSTALNLRAAWEEGWCAVTGSPDGMEIPAAWRRPDKPKSKKNGKPDDDGEDSKNNDAGGAGDDPGATP